MTQERIICAAIHYHDGTSYVHQPKNIETGFVLAGWRHFNILPIATMLGRRTLGPDHTQGFLTSEGRFVNRQEAREIALACGQVTKTINSRDLFSEDLY